MLKYYHVGVDAGGSWSWYYPHLYAPLASSMTNLMDIEISFEKGRYGCAVERKYCVSPFRRMEPYRARGTSVPYD